LLQAIKKHALTIGSTLKIAKLNYKLRTQAMKKHKVMSDYFGKSGMPWLGAMISWAGKKVIDGKDVEGMHVWFLNITMLNASSQ
jgi:hypothetical protein